MKCNSFFFLSYEDLKIHINTIFCLICTLNFLGTWGVSVSNWFLLKVRIWHADLACIISKKSVLSIIFAPLKAICLFLLGLLLQFPFLFSVYFHQFHCDEPSVVFFGFTFLVNYIMSFITFGNFLVINHLNVASAPFCLLSSSVIPTKHMYLPCLLWLILLCIFHLW